MPAAKISVLLHGRDPPVGKNLLFVVGQDRDSFLSCIQTSIIDEFAAGATSYEFLVPDGPDDIAMGPETFYLGLAPFLSAQSSSSELQRLLLNCFPSVTFDAMGRANLTVKVRVTRREYCLFMTCPF